MSKVKHIYKCNFCSWAGSGYCPISTNIGCVEYENQTIINLEEYMERHNYTDVKQIKTK